LTRQVSFAKGPSVQAFFSKEIGQYQGNIPYALHHMVLYTLNLSLMNTVTSQTQKVQQIVVLIAAPAREQLHQETQQNSKE